MKESIKDRCWIEYFMKIGSILAYTVEPWGALETAITPDNEPLFFLKLTWSDLLPIDSTLYEPWVRQSKSFIRSDEDLTLRMSAF